MNSIWILGYGPLLVDKQFAVDYNRLKMEFDGVAMPTDCREGLRLLYDTLGTRYFTYTKYMNQTLGNYGYHVLKRITENHIIVDMSSIRIRACTSYIRFSFSCGELNVFLATIKKYAVEVCMDMQTYTITVDCRVYKENIT